MTMAEDTKKLGAQVREALYGRDGGLQAFNRFEGAHEELQTQHARLVDLHAETELKLQDATKKIAALEAASKK
jgi:hypothetical protein